MDDAKLYYEKCLRSSMRRDELYGRRTKANEPELLQQMKRIYAECHQHPERRERDDVRQGKKEKSSSAIALQYDTFLEAEQTKTKTNNNMHACIKCNKSTEDIEGNLLKCAACKVVSYCSRECQEAVRFYFIAF